MSTVQDVCQLLEDFAPARLAESWDNVGLLVGDPRGGVSRIMTCLTATEASIDEAIEERADLIVTHHPLPFRPIHRITADETVGAVLIKIIKAGIAVYSPHTAFDSAENGINRRLADGLGVQQAEPLVPLENDPEGLGAGRFGQLERPTPLAELADRLKELVGARRLRLVGDAERTVHSVAVACGSAGQLLLPAHRAGCDLLVVGETSFHTCLEAKALDIALLLTGHYASERFAVEGLADLLSKRLPAVDAWASRAESDPLDWV